MLSALCLLACGTDFDTPGEIKGLRVIGLHKSEPFPHPGERVTLDLLWHDTEDRPVEVAWMAGCYNPEADLYQLCFASFASGAPLAVKLPERALNELISGLGADGGAPPPAATPPGQSSIPAPRLIVDGLPEHQFTFQVPSDVISSRKPPLDPRIPHYGTGFVFFAVCAGELTIALEPPNGDAPAFPFECKDRSGDDLGPDGFIAGYTQLNMYETLRNQNPVIAGFEVDYLLDADELDHAFQQDRDTRFDSDAADPARVCVGRDCQPVQTTDGECAVTVAACTKKKKTDCDRFELKPVIAERDNAEADTILTPLGDEPLTQVMWVNYYAERGELSSEVRLLNDAAKGWNDDFGTEFTPPKKPGAAFIWTVAHDNRGGAELGRIKVCVE